MAGMWTRFLPLSPRVRVLLAEGVVGEPQLLTADIGIRPTFDSLRQAHNERPDGQALVEAEAYLVALASMRFGAPARVISAAHGGLTASGHAATILEYRGGQLAALVATTRAKPPQEATIIANAGWIRIRTRWWAPEAFTLTVGVTQQVVHMPVLAGGLATFFRLHMSAGYLRQYSPTPVDRLSHS